MTMLAAMAVAGCLAVSPGSDKILARDMAQAFPELSALPPETPLAPAPLAGAHRIFRVVELKRMALRLGVAADPPADICVERTTALLKAEAALAAMRKTLPEARVELVELSRMPAPEGELEFPLSGLRQAPAGAFWNGGGRYAGARRFPVWAKVRATVSETMAVAAAPLRAGAAIQESDVRLETREIFPEPGAFAASLEDTAGRVIRRAAVPGTPIRRDWLDPPHLVERGDTVRVDARAGGARLELEAIAEGAGASGQIIPVRNPVSGSVFKARVEGKNMVSVGKEKP